jgi:hypothetical protein
MHRTSRLVFLALAALGLALPAAAKFGISKTRVVLPRVRPPESPLLAETVSLDVRSSAPEVTGTYVGLVRGRLEEGLRSSGLYQVVDRGADAAVRVDMDALRAEVRDEIRMEQKRVKVGERQEWDDKKKKMVTKDVYGDRDEPVSWRVADGSLSATLEVEGPDGHRTSDAGGTYHNQFKMEGVPPEAATEESLRRFLVERTAERAVAAVTFSPDPVEVLLAVNGELKAGNRLAEQGLFEQALEEWGKRTYKGDTEAARLHNVGVGHEALAYKFPPFTPEHRSHLEQAQELYAQAQRLDPDEKYFRDPPPRVELSLQYAASAAVFMSELEQFREEKLERSSRAPRGSRPSGNSAPARASSSGGAAPPGAAAPLRNGSFEASLPPWKTTGKGVVVEEPRRGKVFEATPAGDAAVELAQAIGVDVGANGALLSLDYRVVSGEARIRVQIGYVDTKGKTRLSSLEITAGEGPGAWSSWSRDLATLRPGAARIDEVRVSIEGGGVRVDNVALTAR